MVRQAVVASPPSPRPVSDTPGGTVARGTRLGRYVVRGLVGRGAMGEVYRADDPELGRKVAIKLMRAREAGPTPGADAAEARAGLLREARAMARLCHPNVIVVHDVGTFEDGVFVAMDFVEGTTISCWLLAAPRSWQEVMRVFVEAGRGLAAAHDKNLVHHDFKPDNVMIGPGHDGPVRVMDFGLARELRGAEWAETSEVGPLSPSTGAPAPHLRSTTRRLKVVGASGAGAAEAAAAPGPPRPPAASGDLPIGTPAYMSPEQFLASRTDARTDQFSFCVALHEALYGQRPFSGHDILELRRNVFAGNVIDEPRGTRVPGAVRRVLLRGMSPHPGHRFVTMRALLQALQEATAPPARRPWGVALAVACAISLLAAAVVTRAPASARTRSADAVMAAGRPG